MRTDYVVITPDGTMDARSIDWPEEPGYHRIKGLINPIVGGELEHVSVLYENKPADMFVNDVGANIGLPYNKVATDIYHTYGKSRGFDMTKAPLIYGTVVLFARKIWN